MLRLTRETLPAFKERFGNLKPDSPRQFGKIDVAQMLHHLDLAVRVSLGEVQLKDESNIFARTLGPILVFYILPWPKGKIKAPDSFTPPAELPFEDERHRLFGHMNAFIERAEREPRTTTPHPMFGSSTLRFWQRMHGKHMNYHLEQFGV